jgi:hypothetical protein
MGKAAPMNPQSHKRRIAASVVALVVVLGGLLVWQHERSAIAPADVAGFLDTTVGAGRVRFTVSSVETLRKDDSGQQVAVAAKAWPAEPLYTRVDSADYLMRSFQLDAASSADARSLLLDKATAGNAALTGGRPLPEDPFLMAFLEPAAGAPSFDFEGILAARRAGGPWSFSLVSGGFVGAGPQGDARTTFAGTSYVVGDAADAARARQAVSDFQAFAARAAAFRSQSDKARSAAADAHRGEFLARIAPGRVYSGTAVEAGESNATALYLEFTGSPEDNAVTALLRNEGGWRSARAFHGSLEADGDSGNVTLNLSSPASQAVRGAGPFLENTQTWTLELRMDARGELSGQNRFFQYRFQPVPAAQVPALVARLEAEFNQAEAAAAPGTLYVGTVSPGSPEAILLRMTGRSIDGGSFEAAMESTAHPWKRSVHGFLIDNARRSGGEPIRLRTGAKDAAEDAPAASVLGDPEDLEISLGVREGSLAGEDGRFTYQFAPAREADIRRLDSARTERGRHFREVVRPGIALDGALHEDQGFISRVRLEIKKLDLTTGATEANIRSLARSGVYRDFSGMSSPSAGSMSLTAGSRGKFGTDEDFDAPFLTGPAVSTLHLELTGSTITGRIVGDPHWTIEIPAAAFLSATTEGAEADSPPANGSAFPAFPTAPGAYLLSKGAWEPMPKNLGHVASETQTSKSEFKLPPNLIGAVNAGLGEMTKEKDKKKVTFLEFDGKDPRPVSTGQSIVILYAGPEPEGEPSVELAPAETGKDGQRRVELPGKPEAGIRFGEQRLAAYVRSPAPGYILYTTTGVLAPGPYAFKADTGYELTQE